MKRAPKIYILFVCEPIDILSEKNGHCRDSTQHKGILSNSIPPDAWSGAK